MRTQKIPADIVTALRELDSSDLKAVRSFVFFLKTRAVTDPAQAWFWTKEWQTMERSVARDKRAGRFLGDGTAAGLLKSLRRA